MTENNQAKFVSIKDLCIERKVSKATVYRLHGRGLLPFVKIGRATRIRVEDVEAWVRSLPVEGR